MTREGEQQKETGTIKQAGMIMARYANKIMKLNKQLFWDVKFSGLDYKKNADFIIARVLSFGDLADYKAIKNKYGLRKIKDVAKKTNYSNKKSRNFWSFIFNFPICAKKLSTKKQSAFYQR